jgi:hypothetical protein
MSTEGDGDTIDRLHERVAFLEATAAKQDEVLRRTLCPFCLREVFG